MIPTDPDINTKLANSNWQLINKQEGDTNDGWKSITSAMEIFGVGVVLRVSTRQINKAASGLPDMINNSVSETIELIPGARIRKNGNFNEIVLKD